MDGHLNDLLMHQSAKSLPKAKTTSASTGGTSSTSSSPSKSVSLVDAEGRIALILPATCELEEDMLRETPLQNVVFPEGPFCTTITLDLPLPEPIADTVLKGDDKDTAEDEEMEVAGELEDGTEVVECESMLEETWFLDYKVEVIDLPK
ncbi:hypothetical protein J437_LFUL016802, partial [Ladona fulva]